MFHVYHTRSLWKKRKCPRCRKAVPGEHHRLYWEHMYQWIMQHQQQQQDYDDYDDETSSSGSSDSDDDNDTYNTGSGPTLYDFLRRLQQQQQQQGGGGGGTRLHVIHLRPPQYAQPYQQDVPVAKPRNPQYAQPHQQNVPVAKPRNPQYSQPQRQQQPEQQKKPDTVEDLLASLKPDKLVVLGKDTDETWVYGEPNYLEHSNIRVPPTLTCPITKKLMQDPVVASDGFSYERSALEHQYRTCLQNNEPFTTVLTAKPLLPFVVRNRTLKKGIQEWVTLTKDFIPILKKTENLTKEEA